MDAHRVDALEDLADDPVLAGCVEPLEHEQHAAPALGEEPSLERGQALGEVAADLLRRVLAPEAEVVARIALSEPRRRAGRHADRVDHAATLAPGLRAAAPHREAVVRATPEHPLCAAHRRTYGRRVADVLGLRAAQPR